MVFDSSNDQRKCNLPTADEVAAVVPWSDTQVIRGCDITLHYRDGCLNKIPDSSPAYYPLYYVLLFPRGECGWSHDIPKQVEDNNLRQEYDSEDDEQERSAKTVKLVMDNLLQKMDLSSFQMTKSVVTLWIL